MKPSRILCVIAMFISSVAGATAVVNAPAPGFALFNSRHELRRLSTYKGEVVFMNFWASWCGPCQQELPELSRLAAAFRGQKVRVVAINVDTDLSAAQRTLGRLGLIGSHLEILWDRQSKAVSSYNIDAMPSSFVIDSRGLIRYEHHGFHPNDPAVWRKEVSSLLM